ncbi:hypothetical protein EMN47_13280 [Prolixibacteraceae bacterium JC049]|nr:hypothetical protein [Prolixibacteraceae bacterium JC049]
MKQLILILLSALVLTTSCGDDKENNAPYLGYVAGTVESILDGSNESVGFLIKLKMPNNQVIDASVGDNNEKNRFEKGKKVTLKGMISDRFMHVQKIISTNNEQFVLEGEVESIKDNQGGYSAKVVTNEKETFYTLFSISNLSTGYKTFKKGDNINVSGTLWVSDNELNMTVKAIN